MSVIAWDGKTLAADRAVSCGSTMYETRKIIALADGVVLAWFRTTEAGIALARWYEAGRDPEKWPAAQGSDDWAGLIVFRDGCLYGYERLCIEQKVIAPYVAFGSGADVALGAMFAGAPAEMAVRAAIKHNEGCGFGVDAYPAPRAVHEADPAVGVDSGVWPPG